MGTLDMSHLSRSIIMVVVFEKTSRKSRSIIHNQTSRKSRFRVSRCISKRESTRESYEPFSLWNSKDTEKRRRAVETLVVVALHKAWLPLLKPFTVLTSPIGISTANPSLVRVTVTAVRWRVLWIRCHEETLIKETTRSRLSM